MLIKHLVKHLGTKLPLAIEVQVMCAVLLRLFGRLRLINLADEIAKQSSV